MGSGKFKFLLRYQMDGWWLGWNGNAFINQRSRSALSISTVVCKAWPRRALQAAGCGDLNLTAESGDLHFARHVFREPGSSYMRGYLLSGIFTKSAASSWMRAVVISRLQRPRVENPVY